jgi:hypothetical protein
MPRVTTVQTNFTAGEVSPRILGRTDMERYAAGSETLENVVILLQGGIRRRDGLRFSAAARYPTKAARLIPFVFSTTDAYVVELGDQYARFYKNNAQVLETTFAISAATQANPVVVTAVGHNFANGDEVHIEGVLGMLELNGRSFKVAGVAGNNFNLQDLNAVNVNGSGFGAYSSAGTVGRVYTISTSVLEAQLFATGYVQGADTMVITHASLPTQRLRRFSDTSWSQDAIPFDVQPFDEIGDSFANTLTLSLATVGAGRTATASAATFLNGDVGRTIYYQGGFATITGFTSTTVVTITISAAFASVNIPASVWTLGGSPQETVTPGAKDPIETSTTLTSAALNIWRSSDVGKWVRINGGLMLVTSYTSATVVQATVKEALTSVVAAPKNSWSLEANVWSAANGYPRACTFYQQRLVLAGSTAFPQTVWASSTGAYLDFTLGPYDDDAFAYTLASDQINPIIHMASSKALFALTYGGEFTIRGGVEKAVTPTSVQVDSQTAYGAGQPRPLRAGKNILFAQRSLLKLRAMGYDIDRGEYDAPDITAFSEHITSSGIKDIAFAQEPDPLVIVPRVDGVVATMTLSEKQDVAAWSRQVVDGVVESACTIPTATGDQIWMLIKRTVNGATVRYVEFFDPSMVYSLDCAITGTSGAGTATWYGLAHLEGRSVQCVADGFYLGAFTVTGGKITLPRTAKAVVIGLGFSHKAKPLTPEIQTGTGSAQGNAMRTSEVTIRFLNTYSCDVNGDTIDFAAFGSSLLGVPPASFTGVKRGEELGWERGSSDLEIGSSLPYPWHVLSIVRKFTVND